MKNYLTDIKGIKVGHASNEEGMTGCTVVLIEDGATGGIDVRGSAPGTRETDIFQAEKLIDRVHAIVLSGGSAFGLDASTGVVRFLEEKEIGFDTGVTKVPIVSQAVIFDLNMGNPNIRPDANMGYAAAQNASVTENRRGNVGAGKGASVGKILGPEFAMKGGLGSYTIKVGELLVSAMVVVNAVGDIFKDGQQIAGPLKDGKLLNTMDIMKNKNKIKLSNTNTTIGIIATNAILSKSEANKTSQVAHNGYARAIHPVHTMHDGDTIFTLATNEVSAQIDLVSQLASEAMEKAIIDAIESV